MLPIRKLSGNRSGADRDRGTAESPRPKREDASTRPPTGQALARAAAEIISGLHQAKEELAQELEVNLRQLRAVLEETQRIAHQMEAVLNEVRGQPDAKNDEDNREHRGLHGSPGKRMEGRQGGDESRARQDGGQRRENAGDQGGQGGEPSESHPPVKFQLRRKPSWEAPPDTARSAEPWEQWDPPVSPREHEDGWNPPLGWEPPEESGDPWAGEEDW